MNGKTIPSREVFLSSTTLDLAYYRVVAHQVIDKLNDEFNGQYSLTGKSMISEPLSGERETEVEVSRGWVAKADWIVLIVAWHYGFVPEGKPGKPREAWEPCSVTEWEYREATDPLKPPKKCFVFIAGDENDGDLEYRALEKAKEPVNLIGFKGTSKHADKLAAFKDTLKAGRPVQFKLFRNIEHFRQVLDGTLRSKILEDLRPPDVPELESVLMITGLLTPVHVCIEVVKTLATLKRLHDWLHKIRQWGIRRWREEVLTRWKEDSELPVDAERIYRNGQNKVYKLTGEIGGSFRSLTPGLQATLHWIPCVIDHFDVDDDSMPDSRENFEWSTDLFADRVQKAFTDCDWQMLKVAKQLSVCHGQLADKGKDALYSVALKPAERDLLSDEINQSKRLHDRLQRVLAQHNAWQRVHDSLHRVDQWREPEQDDDEPERASFDTRIMPVIDGAKDILDLMASAAQLVEDNERDADWSALIATVQRNLALLLKHPDKTAYDAMRKAFDDLFFGVDSETLKTVEESEQRSTALEEKLRAKEIEFAALRAEAAERRLSRT